MPTLTARERSRQLREKVQDITGDSKTWQSAASSTGSNHGTVSPSNSTRSNITIEDFDPEEIFCSTGLLDEQYAQLQRNTPTFNNNDNISPAMRSSAKAYRWGAAKRSDLVINDSAISRALQGGFGDFSGSFAYAQEQSQQGTSSFEIGRGKARVASNMSIPSREPPSPRLPTVGSVHLVNKATERSRKISIMKDTIQNTITSRPSTPTENDTQKSEITQTRAPDEPCGVITMTTDMDEFSQKFTSHKPNRVVSEKENIPPPDSQIPRTKYTSHASERRTLAELQPHVGDESTILTERSFQQQSNISQKLRQTTAQSAKIFSPPKPMPRNNAKAVLSPNPAPSTNNIPNGSTQRSFFLNNSAEVTRVASQAVGVPVFSSGGKAQVRNQTTFQQTFGDGVDALFLSGEEEEIYMGVEELRAEVRRLKKTVIDITTEKQELERTTKEAITSLRTDGMHLQAEKMGFDAKIARQAQQFEAEKNEQRAEAQQLKRERDEERVNTQQLTKERDDLEAENQELVARLDATVAQLGKEMNLGSELRNEAEQLRTENKRLQGELNLLQEEKRRTVRSNSAGKLQKVERENQILKAEVAELKFANINRVKNLEVGLNQLTNEREELLVSNTQYGAEKKEIESRNVELKMEKREMEDQIKRLETEKKEMEVHISEVEDKIEAFFHEKFAKRENELEERITTLDAEKADLKGEVEEIDNEMAACAAQLEENINKMAKMQDELTHLKEELGHLKSRDVTSQKAMHNMSKATNKTTWKKITTSESTTGQEESCNTHPRRSLSDSARMVYKGLCKHQCKNCTLCNRITSFNMSANGERDDTTIMDLDEPTMRPSEAPSAALEKVFKGLRDEYQHLQLELDGAKEELSKHDPIKDGRARKLAHRELQRITAALDLKAQQLYSLKDAEYGINH